MSGDASFQDLIRRVRTGDGDAATRLVHDYEADVRRVIRYRLRDSSLRKLLDSVDIWQSVLANFFVRAASGQFELDTPDQLRNLLVTMACNRLNDQARRQKAAKRGQGNVTTNVDALLGQADAAATPSHVIAMRDLLTAVQGQLNDEEKVLAERRAHGHEWAEIAQEVGKSPEAIRKQLSRALDRAVKNLGLEE